MPRIDVTSRIGRAHARFADDGGTLGALQRVRERLRRRCGARTGQHDQWRVQARLRVPVERRFAHRVSTALESIEDVHFLLDEGAAEITDHLWRAAAVITQIDDQRIGAGEQL